MKQGLLRIILHFLDISQISGIPNKLGKYQQEEEEVARKKIDITIGNTKIKGELRDDGVTMAPLRVNRCY